MFKNKNKKLTSKEKFFIFAILGGLLIKLLSFLWGKKDDLKEVKYNFRTFVKKEEKEIKQLETGQENFKTYYRDTRSIFRDYFIPHAGNDHKPKLLRTKPLVVIAIAAIILKVAVTGYLFFLYPNEADLEKEMVGEMLRLTNLDRISNNVQPLSENVILNADAEAKAADMIKNDYFAHFGPDGKKPWDWIDRGTYAYLYVGENLAMNFTSAQAAQTALMNSLSHRKNILNDRYHDIGMAIVSGEIDGQPTNILVELFASRQPENLAISSPADHTAGTSEEKVTPKASGPTQVLGTESKPAPAIKPEPVIKPIPSAVKPVSPPEAATATPERIIDNSKISTNTPAQIATPVLAVTQTLDNVKTILESKVANNDLNNQEILMAAVNDRKISAAQQTVDISQYIYIILLIILIIALLINIFIKFEIQHKPVLIQTCLVIIFIVGLFSIHFHFLEKIDNIITLL